MCVCVCAQRFICEFIVPFSFVTPPLSKSLARIINNGKYRKRDDHYTRYTLKVNSDFIKRGRKSAEKYRLCVDFTCCCKTCSERSTLVYNV